MKTLVRTENNLSLYLFDDATIVVIGENKTVVGYPPELIIADCTIANSMMYEGVTAPEDWTGNKYFYTPEDGWVLNPNWNPPPPPPPQEA